ncbi:tetratricopeptide repeat protein [Skermanella mucosa]|uniref:O-linked N-acetylglucosamine transferase, SPINDLY family protein n=1 Tax=Skermanella mucosa TaxID=1789672 RepID=UPI00192C26C3|nr:glycosyltransferase family 41 protein [Skermanella mucosa]UEM19357.1 tetratricopeptide repeat protein [Skermanella mucosa]
MGTTSAMSLEDALALHRAGRLDEAEAAYRSLLAVHPGHADLLRFFGLLRHQQGRADEAIDLLERAVVLCPDSADGRRTLALLLDKRGDRDGALSHYRAAAGLAPHDAGVLNDFGCALMEAGHLHDAAGVLEGAAMVAPEHGHALANLATVLNRLGRTGEALAFAERAAAVRPDHAATYTTLSIALASAGLVGRAVDAARRAAAIEPADASALVQLGNVLIDAGDPDAAVHAYDRALERQPDHRGATENRLYALHLSPTVGDRDLAAQLRIWGAGMSSLSEPRPDRGRDPDRRLRIGYVSADFGRHPVGWFLSPVLPNHDRATVEVHAYSGRVVEDEVTDHLRRHCDSWFSTLGMDDAALAGRIRADGIDLLVDLSGHTAHNHLGVFARTPAPVLATWGGLIGTSGLPAMDWLIGDPRQCPAGAEELHTERIVRLPGGYVPYGPPAYAPAVAPLPALGSGHVTFGCFNRLAKVRDGVIALWAGVLDAVPGSRLFLNTRELRCPDLRRTVAARFAQAGIDADRLELGQGGGHADMLAAYAGVDIALDPFPYSGGLTTLEALWMGVPVVTLPGRRFCSRHSLSHVTVLGHPEWAAADADGYVRIAAALSRDREALARLRAGLRNRMADSPLCDGAGFTRGLEAAYRMMWRRHCSS